MESDETINQDRGFNPQLGQPQNQYVNIRQNTYLQSML
jgi:hypothetical protein